MITRRDSLYAAALLAVSLARPPHAAAAAVGEDGIVRVKSAYGIAETIARLKADVAAKGIMFFSEIDQARLAAAAGVALLPSTLLVFGNPPLGTLFLTSNPAAGLDWPVRLLVHQDAQGDVWAATPTSAGSRGATASPTVPRRSRPRPA